MKQLTLAWLALCSSPLAAQAGTTWYVDAQAAAPGSGTPNAPYTSIQYALDQAATVAGDLLLVAPGMYTESLVIDKAVQVRGVGGAESTYLRPAQPGTELVTMNLPGSASALEGFTLAGPASKLLRQRGGRVLGCLFDGEGAATTGVEMIGGRLISCTVTRCGVGVGGDPLQGSLLHMYGCVIWRNAQDVRADDFGSKAVEYCAGMDLDSSWLAAGPGNLIRDPGLWAPEYGDVRLKPGSHCIDAGPLNLPPDPDGSRADIGVHAYDATHVHGPEIYCVPKPASGGCVPTISAMGTCSASASRPFLIGASSVVEDKLGVLIYGESAASTPFQGGVLCVTAFVRRTSAQLSGSSGVPCSGSFSFDFNAYVQSGVDPALIPGAIFFAQYWFRDPLDPAGFGSGLTNAVRFGVGL